MAKVTQPEKEELEFRPRSSEPRAGVPASRRPPQWQGGCQEGGGLGGTHTNASLTVCSTFVRLLSPGPEGRERQMEFARLQCPRSFCLSSVYPAKRPIESFGGQGWVQAPASPLLPR